MPKRALSGTRIRERRTVAGLKQSELAARVGISPSYLNLIEHNRRRIGGSLLVSLADALGVEAAVLAQGAEAEMLTTLQDAAHSSDVAQIESERIEELAGRFPGWVAHIAGQHRRIASLERTVNSLNDRLTHDPVLSEKMHEVLAAVSAIRSTSAILVAEPDIDPDWRTRFHTNIDAESRRLAETSAAMAAHFDRIGREESGFATPLEAAAEFFDAHGFHFPALEAEGETAVQAVLAAGPTPPSKPARAMVRAQLVTYARDAAALPLAAFAAAARESAYDPAALAHRFGAPLEQVFRRLASLPAGPDLPAIGLIRCDASGAFILRKQPPGFPMPRFGAACPLWPLYSALSAPGMPVRRILETTENTVFTAYAVAGPSGQLDFDGPPVHTASMLLVGDRGGANPDAGLAGSARLSVGASCRVCPRARCPARREPSILADG
ncbi:MAG: DUF2083 domain-containing protein [Paracoccaceae bacterium]